MAPQKSGSVGTRTCLSTPNGLREGPPAQPRHPPSPAQQHLRGLVSACAGQWRQLDAPTRAGWRALARQWPGHLSGFHAYTRVNVILAHGELPARALAPARPRFGRLLCTGLVVDATPSLTLRGLSHTVAPDAAPLGPGHGGPTV
jgi:hypothetical protein